MKGYLHLQSGDVFEGEWVIGNPSEHIEGEVVFYTGMTGYQEVLTDPSYKEQILVFTYPLIGNYGINQSDFESKKPHVAGVVVYEINGEGSHYQSAYSLQEYLEKWKVPLLSHVDTRAVVKEIRKEGSMPAQISKESEMCEWKEQPVGKVVHVSEKENHTYGKGKNHILLIDYGTKKSIINALLERDCKVTVVPYNTPFQRIKAFNPDGILLSNGPGDPKDLTAILPDIKQVIHHYPTLGICLGHQLAALALGGDTKKLPFGHRGANHPVKDMKNNKVFMSSQNHSYVVEETSLQNTGLVARFYNLHDQSVEGLCHNSLPIQTVQFHPEAHPGPSEGAYIFDEFLRMVDQQKRSAALYA